MALDLRDRPSASPCSTRLGADRHGRTQRADQAPDQSVSSMRKVIETLDKDRSGSFFNYDGTVIPW
jgi:hypothetical protein